MQGRSLRGRPTWLRQRFAKGGRPRKDRPYMLMAEEKELQQQIQRIEELVGKIETLPDPAARAGARELVQSLMDFHGTGIERMLEMIAETGTSGIEIMDMLAGDRL